MNVRELIALLSALNPETEVVDSCDWGTFPVQSLSTRMSMVTPVRNPDFDEFGVEYRGGIPDSWQHEVDDILRVVETVELSFNPKRE